MSKYNHTTVSSILVLALIGLNALIVAFSVYSAMSLYLPLPIGIIFSLVVALSIFSISFQTFYDGFRPRFVVPYIFTLIFSISVSTGFFYSQFSSERDWLLSIQNESDNFIYSQELLIPILLAS